MAKPRDHAAIYARRKARGLAQGKTLNESVGKASRDYSAEYAQRVSREVAQGKRKPPSPRPRSNKSPAGNKLAGAHQYFAPNAGRQAERTISKLASSRRVFVYARVAINGTPEDLTLWPNGGIRAQALRLEIAGAGGLEALIREHVMSGQAVAVGVNPRAVKPYKLGDSPRYRLDKTKPIVIEIRHIVLQWSA